MLTIEYQPISTAPIDGTEIMGYWESTDDQEPVYYHDDETGWVAADRPIPVNTPSHWKPIK